jgi:hypothetical protein
MTASIPAVDPSVPTVAIVGNDAVLAAAPATPVQLAHACLRRGFTVAVPASWGDELIAAEVVRGVASRERGPAVMCVCPFVRARLLAPGPDLAPFLISLVSPPVAAARYVRAIYGEYAVHVTYIGACPGGDDPSIDVRLTPDAFIADLAEHGIALSEQPLVFDSIVPPDRRRWCSLPGGVPSAEVLWSETDGRTCIGIEREEIAADLAQHIMAREHVLLDLAPGLGCACSGATGLVTADRARATVTAAEPPRALSPVIDAAAFISLRVPVGAAAAPVSREPPSSAAVSTADAALERVLDEMLGADDPGSATDRAGEATVDDSGHRGGASSAVGLDLPQTVAALPGAPIVAQSGGVVEWEAVIDSEPDADTVPDAVSMTGGDERGADTVTGANESTSMIAVAEMLDESPHTSQSVAFEDAKPTAGEEARTSGPAGAPHAPVRRRTPPAMLSRYAAASIPKTTGPHGRPVPRAYVAKRRTPPTGAAVVAVPQVIDANGSDTPRSPVEPPASPGPDLVAGATSSGDPNVVSTHPEPRPRPESDRAEIVPLARPHPADDDPASAGDQTPPAPPPSTPRASSVTSSVQPEPEPTVSSDGANGAGARTNGESAMTLLLVGALIGLALFVVLALRR